MNQRLFCLDMNQRIGILMPSAYLAGPMRGKRHWNFPAFYRAEKRLVKRGWIVTNPAAMDVKAGEMTRKGKPRYRNTRYTPKRARQFAKRDLNILINVLKAENGDAIIMLPGWKKSMGARAENAVARWVGLRRLTLKEALR